MRNHLKTSKASPVMVISGILLAAGKSTRMGTPKLLMPWGEATLIEAVVNAYARSRLSELIVVVGAHLEDMRRALGSKTVHLVENPRYEEGMGTSLRAGIEAASHEAEAYLIGLGDQPLITSDTISLLIATFVADRPGIAVCAHQGRPGHPVIFDHRFHHDLCSIQGDKGARHIIEQHREEVKYVEVGSTAIFADIDTLDDYHTHAARAPFS